MDSTQLESDIALGETILMTKRYILSFYFLWFWDYVLTFKDEVDYAWKGKKSWVFILFLLNRYWPLPYIVWMLFASYWSGYSQEACDKTAFLTILYFNLATLFAQTTLTLRVYVVTGKNKVLTAILLGVSLIQISYGFFLWVDNRKHGSQHRPITHLDAFQLCFFNPSRAQVAVLSSLSLIYDLLAFLVVIWEGRKRGDLGRPGIPMILTRIVKDAVVYFSVIFGSQLIVECFILFAPSSYQPLPAMSSAIFVPMMATHIMLSLKIAADKSSSYTRTESEYAVTDVVFADYHVMMEHAMDVGVSRHNRDQMIDLELENRP